MRCLVLTFLISAAFALSEDDGKTYWMEQAQQTLRNAILQRHNMKVAKNVILLLGDGMGVSTVTAARIYKGQKAGQTGEETQLNFEKWPHVALSKTYNTDRQVPDSAGTATAYLCGAKANYATLGVDSRVARADCSNIGDTDTHTTSILDWSLAAGKSVGLVTTARVTHATPGAGYAHTPERNWETDKDIPDSCPGVKDIAYQLLKDNADIHVMLGGGRREFYNRKDGRKLPEEWLADKQEKGLLAKYVQNATAFRAVSAADTDYLLGLFAESHMTYELSRDNSEEPSLSEMTRKAIEILQKNNKGFFLLVEGGRIDHGHHDNYAKRALEETVAFDDAVAVAMEMTGDNTLLVVTADHSHVFNIAGYASRGNNILGLVDKVDEVQKTVDNMPYTTLVYANGPGPGREQNLTGVDTTADDYRFQRLVPFQPEWETHGGEDVGIYATGPMSHLFHGVHEQNYIAHVMAYASCVGPNNKHCENPEDEYSCSGATAVVNCAVVVHMIIIPMIVCLLVKNMHTM
ncbi:alkaline phosphatase, tissue-nonspecific isozyme-like isoform X1 [Littorina saxatilis]|uniref:alkaline phosphatase, tissue-nonspecific isozyme-like isoform X1 n=1 Tax=Littorina saxatilis TaxID=31220 RepID=UPI0038B5E1C5